MMRRHDPLTTAGPAGPAGDGRRWLLDGAIAALVTAVSLASLYGSASWHPNQRPASLAGYLLVAAGGMSLTARRRYPVAVLAVTLVTALLAGPLGHAGMVWLPLIVAFFTAVAARRRVPAIISLIIGYTVSVWPPWLIGRPHHTAVAFALALLCGLLAMLSAAELTRDATQRRAAQRQLREQEVLRRAGEERMRIARDVHDVVAHNISVINVQANTALHLMDRQPERAREALTAINQVSKQALTELRSVLGVLRDSGESAPRAPAPGLGRLTELAGRMHGAGLDVHIEQEGTPVPLPASTELAAYRIVQEALTNSARHSGSPRASVRVRYQDGQVEIQVDDDGTAGSGAWAGHQQRPAGGTGNGIAGMTERARALGGSLSAGPRPDGGFRVTARLPARGGAR
jgi:signal transduction histidine kinase